MEKNESCLLEKKENKNGIKKKILLIIAILLIILLITTIRKFVIISNLEDGFKNIETKNNYYIEKYTLQGNMVNIVKSHNKDSKYLTTIQAFGIDIKETRKITIYDDTTSQIGIIQAGENKIALLNGPILGGNIRINTIWSDEMGFWYKLNFALLSKIRTEECNNKKCYLIEPAKGWKLWVDKETGLIVREINGGSVTDYNYKFDIVKDEDIIKPDISDCKIQENN